MNNVPLYKNHKPIMVKNEKFCLSHLTSLLFSAANEPTEENFSELIEISQQFFKPLDKSKLEDFENIASNSTESGLTPPHDSAYYFEFTGSGSYLAPNINGVLELLFNKNDFIQFGYQLRINPVILFGIKKAYRNVYTDTKSVLMKLYSGKLEVASRDPIVEVISNNYSHSYISTLRSGRNIIFSYRIGNRILWDSFIDNRMH